MEVIVSVPRTCPARISTSWDLKMVTYCKKMFLNFLNYGLSPIHREAETAQIEAHTQTQTQTQTHSDDSLIAG